MTFTFIFGLGRAQTVLYGPRHHARRTARRAVPRRTARRADASLRSNGNVRAGLHASPRGPVPGFRPSRCSARRQVFGARAASVRRPVAQAATCARLHCLYLLGGDGQCVAITAPARLVRHTGPCAVRSAGARQLVRPVPASRRRDPADGSHVEMSLCRHPEIHLTVLARGAQLTEPVRREPRLRQSRQYLLSNDWRQQKMQMSFFLTEFISKISGNLRFFGLGGSPRIDATSCHL